MRAARKDRVAARECIYEKLCVTVVLKGPYSKSNFDMIIYVRVFVAVLRKNTK